MARGGDAGGRRAAGRRRAGADRLVHRRRRPEEPALAGGRGRLAFSDLRVGDYVVHEDHGVARFAGFETREVAFGREDANGYEVVFGLDAGTEIATGNAFVLRAELSKSEAGHAH